MNTDMKPFNQGYFSRYCSVYSTLNALQALGLKLKYNEWQELYDHIIYGVSYFEALYELNSCGASHKRLEMIFHYANEWLEQYLHQKLIYARPYWNVKLNLAELTENIKQQALNGEVALIRVKSEFIDHYTIVKRITKYKIKFYDSTDLEDILLKNIDTTDCRKYQICLRQVYFLSLEAV